VRGVRVRLQEKDAKKQKKMKQTNKKNNNKPKKTQNNKTIRAILFSRPQ
jgi:hypothetical protein